VWALARLAATRRAGRRLIADEGLSAVPGIGDRNVDQERSSTGRGGGVSSRSISFS
jgi:hypothetical protein